MRPPKEELARGALGGLRNDPEKVEVNYDYFARWAARARLKLARGSDRATARAAISRLCPWVSARRKRMVGGTGSATNGHVLRRAPRALIRRASRGGHMHAHTTKPRRTPRGGPLR